jgi:hypothetical protein
VAGQTVEVFGASSPRVVPAKPRSQRNSESLVGVVGATILFGGLAWVIGGWVWALGIGLIVLAVGMKKRSDARNEWRRMTKSPPGTIWVKEYKDAKGISATPT